MAPNHNLIASNISAPLVTFPDASFGTNTNVPQQSFQRKWQFKDDIPGGGRLLRIQLDSRDRFRRRPQRNPGQFQTLSQGICLVALNNPFSNPYVSKLPHDDNKDFSPRVGFAYDLTGTRRAVDRPFAL